MDGRIRPILARRSVRTYTGEPVSKQDIRALLEAGMAAPSAKALDPWHFVVVTEPDRLKQLAEIHPYGRMLAPAADAGAGAAIAVCGDKEAAPDFWVQDCSAATENILLAASMLGLGTVWLGVHPRAEREQPLKEFLGIPDPVGILCLIAIGKPAEQLEPRTRYDEAKAHRETW